MTSSASVIFQLENMTASQGGEQVLNVPFLELAQGKVLAVVGSNGSGKTTLLLCLAGLLNITSGRLIFRGRVLSDNSRWAELRRHVTLAFQEPLLFSTTVRANIESGLRFHGISGVEKQQRVGQTAQLLGISGLLDRSARKLSGGESQRVSLARALALEPDVLLLDEPFSALDSPSKRLLLDDLGKILKDTSTTAVFSTHDLTDAIYLADYIAVLNRGQLVQSGTVQEILRNSQDSFVAEIVANARASAEIVIKTASDSASVDGDSDQIAAKIIRRY